MLKRQLFTSLLFFSISVLVAQNFTWVRGDNTSGPVPGFYGTQGTPTSSTTPGHRHGSATWVDASGNLWLFGGEGYSTSGTISWLNDLWKYNPGTNQWTWIRGLNGPNAPSVFGTQGVASATNEPGAREFPITWTDNSGNFWLFGGANNAGSGWLGDLWKYNPATNMWTYMKGFTTADQNGVYGTLTSSATTNMPGCRTASGHWVDSNGDLWLFGGRGFAASGGSGLLNDLWKYSVTTNNWTWMGGSNLIQQNGVYGSMGTPSGSNVPGGTEFPCSWTDANGKFYLLTGRGFVSSGSPGYTCDMWKYDPLAGTWVWLKGPNLTNQSTVYGQAGVSSASTQPGGRYTAAHWKDANGNFWLFGGLGWAGASSTSIGSLNDLFKYDPVSNQYTWIKGSTATNANGTYGSLGVAAAANVPGARMYNVCWTSSPGTFWLLGGEGYDISSNSVDNMNDLWKFSVPCNPDSVVSASGKVICTGSSATLTAFNQFPANVQWYSSATSTTAIGTGTAFNTGTLSASSQSVYTYYAQANSCTLTPRTPISLTVTTPPTLSATASNSVCSGSTVSLIASGASSYTWTNGPSSASFVATPTANSTFTVSGSNAPGCNGSATVGVTVSPLPTLSTSATRTIMCLNDHSTLTVSGASTYTWVTPATIANSIVVTSSIGGLHNYTVNATDANGCKNQAVISVSVYAFCNINGLTNYSGNTTEFSLYPNPSHGTFKIKVDDVSTNSLLKIINILGEQVYTQSLDNKETQVHLNLPKGIYFARLLEAEEITGTVKVIIE